MPIVGLSNFASAGDGDGANGRELPPYGPGGIYHEKQIGSLCAVHCVNNMLQGPFFSEREFDMVARELDRKEQQLTGGAGLDYGNARMDGFYNVQVMQILLKNFGYDMQALHPKKEGGGVEDMVDTALEKAFILNKKEHWFTLRRLLEYEWFDLNSCLKTPRHYNQRDLRFHIGDALREGYTVFVVRGPFPKTELEEEKNYPKLVEAIQGCGRSDQGYSIFAGSGQRLDAGASSAAAAPAPAASDKDAIRAARMARFGTGSAPAPEPPPAPPAAPTPTPAAAPVPAPAAPAAAPDSAALQQLLAMGFPRDRAVGALEASAGNAEMAAELLLSS